MRLTVGPLPPAVYWRRRALVLGTLLVVIILMVYSCGESPESNADATNAGSTAAAPQGADATETQRDTSPPPSTSASPAPASPTTSPLDPSFCTDEELLVTPAPADRRLPRGATTTIVLKIKNISDRTCKRDVGPDQQELYIVERGGAEKVWSSDDCGGPRGTNVKSFTPDFERAYTASWNGRESSSCKGQAIPAAGKYQVYGRLGTKRSKPVTLTLT